MEYLKSSCEFITAHPNSLYLSKFINSPKFVWFLQILQTIKIHQRLSSSSKFVNFLFSICQFPVFQFSISKICQFTVCQTSLKFVNIVQIPRIRQNLSVRQSSSKFTKILRVCQNSPFNVDNFGELGQCCGNFMIETYLSLLIFDWQSVEKLLGQFYNARNARKLAR